MGNPLQTIPNLPPAIALSGEEQLWINQAGVDKRTTALALALVGGAAGGAGLPTALSYAEMRSTIWPPAVGAIFLNDPYKGGVFVRGPSGLPDNGGTRIIDARGQTWVRLYDERINARWFYDAPPNPDGAPTTLGSGPIKITQADIDAHMPIWVGLADDGGVGVQTAQPYPVGTYWDFVALQEWIYACAAERSVPQTTFIGSMNNDGKVTVSQWLTGPRSLAVGQPISGVGVDPATVVVALTNDPNVYWIGKTINTSGLDITTARGTTFRGWIEGYVLTSSGSTFSGPPLQAGDVITDPFTPPNPYYEGVWPGTTVGPQIDGPPGGGLGVASDWVAAVAQTVASGPMTGVGGPNWNTNGRQLFRNQPGYCPAGNLYLNQMLVCNGNGLDLLFGSRLGTSLLWYGTATGTSNLGPAIKFNTLAYSAVTSLNITDESLGGVTPYLVSISHTGTTTDPGLAVQNNAFREWSIGGNYLTSTTGVAVSPQEITLAVQGDTQWFYGITCAGFTNGITLGGDNAIGVCFFGGQTLGCPGKGVWAQGGSFAAYTMLAENNASNTYYSAPQRTQIHMGGADFYAQQVSSESCISINTRSEGMVGFYDFSHESLCQNWTCGGSFFSWAPNMHWTPQTLIHVVDGFGNPIEQFDTVLLADDGGPPWMQSDANSTTTVLEFTPSPGWTVNQWANFGIWLRSGASAASYAIQSNTANTITLVNPVNASGANWWKIFNNSSGAPPNWAATTHFGQFQRNATGWGCTFAQGFNVFSSGQPLNAGDWVMLPGAGVFPDGAGIKMAQVGQVENPLPSSTGWYMYSQGNVATVWGTPNNPITLGAQVSATSFNFFVAQTAPAPPAPQGAAGTYTMAFSQTLGAGFTGQISGNQLEVTNVAWGSLAAGQAIGGAGITSAPAPLITNVGPAFIGYVDDGTGGSTPGNVLTVTSVTSGTIRLGAPVTGGLIAPGTVVLSQTSGTPGGVGVYVVSGPAQLSGQSSFTATIDPVGHINVSAVASGVLVPGQFIQGGTGLTHAASVSTQISGVKGGVGTYNSTSGFNPAASGNFTGQWQLTGGGQAAQFTATLDNGAGAAGMILTVSAVATGVLGVGQTVNIPVTGGPAGLTQQATIIRGLNDTGTGGPGTYTLSGIGKVLIPSTNMTANTTNGIGVYTLNSAPGDVASEAMFAGYASSIPPLWHLVDKLGDPLNFGQYGIDAFGYWSAGIPDGGAAGLTWMVIDWDIMYGVGALDQCQLPFGKVTTVSRMDNASWPTNARNSQFVRPNAGYLGQFSYRNQVVYSSPANQGATLSTNPASIGVAYMGQSTIFATISQSLTLTMDNLGPGMLADFDVIFTSSGGPWTLTWGAGIKAPAPTLGMGTSGQITIVRMKWIGNSSVSAPSGTWFVMSIEGPM